MLYLGGKKVSLLRIFMDKSMTGVFGFFFSEMEMAEFHLQFSTKPLKNALGKQISLLSRYSFTNITSMYPGNFFLPVDNSDKAIKSYSKHKKMSSIDLL